MKTNNNITSFKQLLLTVVALLVMAGCSSDSWEGTPDALTHEVEPVPIRLSVKGNVVITSDVAMTNIMPHVAGEVTNTLVDGQEVGIFVIDAATLVDMEDIESGINFTSDYSIAYANVKGRIKVNAGSDTQITALDAEGNPITLYYPKVKETTVYVLVYAPYQGPPYQEEGITLEQFRNGFDFTVQTTQDSETEYQQSDLLVGWKKVSTTNCFREQSTEQSNTPISLRHALSRIGLDLNYGGDGGYKHIGGALTDAQARASLCNVYTTARVNLYSTILTAENSSSSSTDAEVVIDGASDPASISMGAKNSFANIAFNSLENTLYCIVPPQVVNDEGTEQKAAFSVVVGDNSPVVGTLKNKTFEGGKSYNYKFPWTDLVNREPTSITHLEVRNFR